MQEPPIAIIITMPKAFFEDRKMTEDEFMQEFETCLSYEDGYWNFLKKNLPIHVVPYCYIVFGGKVQYKVNVVDYERNTAKTFIDAPDGKQRVFKESNWILISGPVVKSEIDIPMKGFQGHRYLTQELF